ncbi:hypothetical protein CKO25_03545 [Thiocapsa imhoffii]|uniref:Gamma-glutamylcyclotransferase AIG2-like domain-containing protein n=1 Tax=Thiocapsa imhoffii TaxID=382777 RepID=A0A9X0WGI1_9GAMM|nr:gamma-glutamylcyclotransferase family protein [Thiocapsa imhoffii]MBK1643747.1 hypothetical protein [Thiocapsa imhoffii]
MSPRPLIASLTLALVGGLWWLWFTFLSPFGFTHPEDLAPSDSQEMQQIFVYGTLRSPLVRWLVLGRAGETHEARLPDHRKVGLDVQPDPRHQTPGLIIRVTAEELRRLDRYERLGVRYERSKQPLSDGSWAWVYQRIVR